MSVNQLFTVAGTSKLKGEYKVRFANDVLRLKVLAKHGHEDIELVELPSAMSKLDAVKFIQGLDEFQGAGAQSAIADYLDRKGSAPKAPTAKPTAATKPAKAVKATKVAADEDAPF
jgi:hypothetical protein